MAGPLVTRTELTGFSEQGGRLVLHLATHDETGSPFATVFRTVSFGLRTPIGEIVRELQYQAAEAEQVLAQQIKE